MFSRSFRFECLAFDPSGTHLAVGDELGKGRIIELQSSLLKVSTYPWHQQKVSALQFSPDDTLLYSAGYDNRLVVFDIRRESVIRKETYRNYWNGGDYILKKLEESSGNVTRAAELLGLERSNLYRKMKALGITFKD